MTIERNRNGAFIISDIVRGCLFSRAYYGYTRREATRAFQAEAKQEDHP